MSQENVEIVRHGYRLLAAGDVDGLTELIHPEFELRPVVAGASDDAVYRGRAGVRQYVLDVADTWDRFQQIPQRFLSRGEDVVVILDLNARGKGSGIELSQEVAVVWTFKDGKPWRGVGYLDPADALEAVGLSE